MPPRDLYSPVPTEKPAQVRGDVATPQVHIGFPDVRISGAVGDALEKVGQQGFGTLSRATAHVGAAFDSLGKSLEGAGDKIFQRAIGLQELENETQRNKAMVEFEQYGSEKKLELDQKKGANATGATLKMFNEDMEQKRQELRGKLSQSQQRLFDPASTLFAGRLGIHAATHIATEVKASALGASNARVDLAVKAMGEANTQQEFTEQYNIVKDNTYNTAAPIQGWTREEAERAVRLKAQHGFGSMLSRLSESDPKLAWKMKNENPDMFIDPAVEERVRHTMQTNEIRWATRGAVDRATSDLWEDRGPEPPKKTEAERIKEAKEGAEKVLSEEVKSNPTAMSALNQQIESSVISAVRRQESAVNNQRTNSFYSITAQFRDPNGNLKDNLDAVLADPQTKALYGDLPLTGPHSQESVRVAFDLMQRRGERIDPLVSGQNRRLIEGMAQHDEESRMKLMDMNIYDPKLKMNRSDRDAVYKVREQLKAKPGGDPRVARDWKWLEEAFPQQLKALGLLGVKKDDDNLIRAKGDLWAALQAYEETHKGVVPDYKALIGEIGPQLLRGKTWEWQLGVTPSGFPRVIKPEEDPGFKQEVPESKAEDIRKDYRQRMGHDPTDDQIFRAYRQSVWEEFYQGKREAK